MILLLACLLLLPASAASETLAENIDSVISTLDLAALEQAAQTSGIAAGGSSLTQTLSAIAKGEVTLAFDQVMEAIFGTFFGAVKGSLWRLTLTAPPRCQHNVVLEIEP